MADLSRILNEAQKLVAEVADFIRKESVNFNQDRVELKSFNNLVSYVDTTAEKKLIEGLGKILPGSGFLAEESSAQEPVEDYTWIIDPLDGTTNFVHRLPVFSISVALKHHHDILLGVVFEVNSKDCFSAIANKGAFCNNHPIEVSTNSKLEQSLIATGFPYDNFDELNQYFGILKDFMLNTHGVRRLGSAAVDLCYVANGTFEGFYEYNLNPWDVAAGALIVQEAKGTVSDFSGGNNFLFGKEIIAAGPVYRDMLKIISNHWKSA